MSEKKLVEKKELEQLMAWVTTQIQGNDTPRFSDVVDYAHRVLKLTCLLYTSDAADE